MGVIGQYVATPPFIQPLQIEHTSMKSLYPIIELEFCLELWRSNFASEIHFASELHFGDSLRFGASLRRFISLRSFTSEIRFASELHFGTQCGEIALLGFHKSVSSPVPVQSQSSPCFGNSLIIWSLSWKQLLGDVSVLFVVAASVVHIQPPGDSPICKNMFRTLKQDINFCK